MLFQVITLEWYGMVKPLINLGFVQSYCVSLYILDPIVPIPSKQGTRWQRCHLVDTKWQHCSNVAIRCLVWWDYLLTIMVTLCIGQEAAHFCAESKYVPVNARDNAGYTPLHECCATGQLRIAQCLLSHGADPNISNRDGVS